MSVLIEKLAQSEEVSRTQNNLDYTNYSKQNRYLLVTIAWRNLIKEDDLFPEPCDANCPVRKTTEIIDGKWTTLIIQDLLSGKKRYSELLKSLEGKD